MELQLPKGTRDFPPQEKILRDEVVGKLKAIFERYGFNPLETPTFERYDVLSAKYAGGNEILKETFTFNDQGERNLALRYDLTVPFARYIGMNPQVKMPFKRYQVGRVYRDGPIKLGRYREFYQCDADIVGTRSVAADAELLRVAAAGFKSLGIKVLLSVNNRALLEELLTKGGVAKAQLVDAMLTLDKIKKVGVTAVKKELAEKKIPAESVDFIIKLATEESSNDERLAKVRAYLGEESTGYQAVNELFTLLTGVKNVTFDPSLARGLAYYTGMVFEGFAVESTVNASVCGGGRYDELIGDLLANKQSYPATGFSFGLEPILDVMKEERAKEQAGLKQSLVQVYVCPIKTLKECVGITEQLRDAGVNADVDVNGKGISKNLDYANAYKIPFVLIAGPQELAEDKVKLKDMDAGTETLLTVDEVITKLSPKA